MKLQEVFGEAKSGKLKETLEKNLTFTLKKWTVILNMINHYHTSTDKALQVSFLLIFFLAFSVFELNVC